MGLDIKDKKILYYLDEDAFQPVSFIAKKIRASKQVVAYRIDELKKKGVLVKTCAIINLARLGYEFYKFYIRYKVMAREKEIAMLSDLDAHPRVGYMCICDGRFDLFVGVWARGTNDLYNIRQELFTRYKMDFEEITVSAVVIAFNSKRGYLIETEAKSRVPLFGGEIEEGSIDRIDEKILGILTKDARRKYTEIAKEINLTPSAVGYRIKELKGKGIIEGARIVLDKSKMGYLQYKVLVKTGSAGKEMIKKFVKSATRDKNVVDIDLTLGDWDVELDIEIENHEKFHQLMLGFRSTFPEVIESYNSLIIFKEVTYDYFPVWKSMG